MNIRLIGIVEDGTPRRTGVPTSSEQTIDIVRGESVTVEVAIVNPGNVRQGPVAADSVAMTVSKGPGRGQSLVKTAAVAGNVATFSIVAADFKNFTLGRYVYDVWWNRHAGGRYQVVRTSALNLLANVTAVP